MLKASSADVIRGRTHHQCGTQVGGNRTGPEPAAGPWLVERRHSIPPRGRPPRGRVEPAPQREHRRHGRAASMRERRRVALASGSRRPECRQKDASSRSAAPAAARVCRRAPPCHSFTGVVAPGDAVAFDDTLPLGGAILWVALAAGREANRAADRGPGNRPAAGRPSRCRPWAGSGPPRAWRAGASQPASDPLSAAASAVARIGLRSRSSAPSRGRRQGARFLSRIGRGGQGRRQGEKEATPAGPRPGFSPRRIGTLSKEGEPATRTEF